MNTAHNHKKSNIYTSLTQISTFCNPYPFKSNNQFTGRGKCHEPRGPIAFDHADKQKTASINHGHCLIPPRSQFLVKLPFYHAVSCSYLTAADLGSSGALH